VPHGGVRSSDFRRGGGGGGGSGDDSSRRRRSGVGGAGDTGEWEWGKRGGQSLRHFIEPFSLLEIAFFFVMKK
jgi:hypothetical protein